MGWPVILWEKGEGSDVSPFSPKLSVQGQENARPPLELASVSPIPLLLLDHCPGAQLCILGRAGVMLKEAQLS